MNKVIFSGRMAKEPEQNLTNVNKRVVVNFPIAVDRRLVLGREKETDFFNVVAWQSTGEFVMRNFKKGQPITVVGRLQQRSWFDEASQTTRYTVEIVAEEVHFAGFLKEDSQNNGATYSPNFNPYENEGQGQGQTAA